MEKIFEPILDNDEKVIKVFKPQKCKMLTSIYLTWLFCWMWILFPLTFGLLFDEDGYFAPQTKIWIIVAITLSVILIFSLLSLLFANLCHKNTYFAYTNKRVIIRKGIFGVDYKSLDMSMIGAVTVNVSLLDKIMRKNTGSIAFGSMASPIGGQNAYMFKFSHILAPYETYKEIKNVIDEYKNKKDSK